MFNCEICGHKFTRRGIKKLTARFCSNRCRGLHQRGKLLPGVNYEKKRIGIKTKCIVCGKEYYVSPCRREKSRYCSMECRNKDGYFWKNVTGDNHWNWKGGIRRTGGYLYIKAPDQHPLTQTGGFVAEHRLVMEKKLGRYLTKEEEVHHINGIKDDNRFENLELVVKKIHHGNVKCPYCQKGFKVK